MKTFLSFLTQSFPPKPKFKVDDIPDLSDKVVIVTGGNSGVGKETVKASNNSLHAFLINHILWIGTSHT
jgi:hypothetical protein